VIELIMTGVTRSIIISGCGGTIVCKGKSYYVSY